MGFVGYYNMLFSLGSGNMGFLMVEIGGDSPPQGEIFFLGKHFWDTSKIGIPGYPIPSSGSEPHFPEDFRFFSGTNPSCVGDG